MCYYAMMLVSDTLYGKHTVLLGIQRTLQSLLLHASLQHSLQFKPGRNGNKKCSSIQAAMDRAWTAHYPLSQQHRNRQQQQERQKTIGATYNFPPSQSWLFPCKVIPHVALPPQSFYYISELSGILVANCLPWAPLYKIYISSSNYLAHNKILFRATLDLLPTPPSYHTQNRS